MRCARLLAALLCSLVATPALASDSFDLATWALSLDSERPASGAEFVYEGGEPIPPDYLPTLRTSLYADDPLLPLVAVEELAVFGVPHGEALLLELARSERWSGLDEDLQAEVVRALELMRSGRALPVLARISLVEHGLPSLRAVQALCRGLAPEAEPPLRAIISGGDPRKQKVLIRCLRRAGERDSAREARRQRRDDRREDRVERKDDRRFPFLLQHKNTNISNAKIGVAK